MITPTMIAILILSFWPMWVVSDLLRKISVSGSRQRYLFSSVTRVFYYPAGLDLAILLLVNLVSVLGEPSPKYFIYLFINIWVILSWAFFSKNDDDDYWTGRWKKIKKWIKNHVGSRGLVPVGVKA